MIASAQDQSIIEAVPNFSEGRDQAIIRQITDAMALDKDGRLREGMRILHVDSGIAANRTVVTLAGSPDAVTEALFEGIRKATELIDMRRQQGVHPRLGATDVCPLIPLQHVSMQQTVQLARKLARRVGEDLQIPVFLYEAARLREERKRLATIRKGEFEGLAQKIQDVAWQPDYGPAIPHPTAGAIVIGARPFLIAFNVHLDTSDVQIAKTIAKAVRDTGRPEHSSTNSSNPVNQQAGLAGLRAIGWYVEEYGLAQVSMNITDVVRTPLHLAFESVKQKASEMGIGVKGSEIIGLVPLACLLEAGTFYARQKGIPADNHHDEESHLKLAIEQLGLHQLHPFEPRQKILEYVMQQYPDVFSLKSVPLPLAMDVAPGIYPPEE
ncbi:glutamate formimidoyltransferase [Thermoflavifilum thermophilum]|uniref:glutamate formimidoyltransferase n=1 Tax=Thermoflavifilum thermophilum TaxID=1393122 RepID=A0A1I7NHH4_9BACT|nr:glutamate formimidoyltransferase [Thermoflavifilum thermophilum]SFV34125.1 glutamate formiminotransferase [Thermoflavifilum thermophilum]